MYFGNEGFMGWWLRIKPFILFQSIFGFSFSITTRLPAHDLSSQQALVTYSKVHTHGEFTQCCSNILEVRYSSVPSGWESNETLISMIVRPFPYLNIWTIRSPCPQLLSFSAVSLSYSLSKSLRYTEVAFTCQRNSTIAQFDLNQDDLFSLDQILIPPVSATMN